VGAESLTYAIVHRTVLRYSQPVAPSYNEVRMRPRDSPTQRTLSFAMRISPATVPRPRVDYFGNHVDRVDVITAHDTLEFCVDAVVQHTPEPPARPSPWEPAVLDRDPRLEYALATPRVPLTHETAALLHEWCGGDRSIDALLAVAERIPRHFRYLSGATTVRSGIDELLAGGAGVCQDFTHLFLAMARHAGWPARYVSGYLGPARLGETTRGASHAWAEVCDPDGRWLGIDPTHGCAAGPQHLRLAVGRDYDDVAPHRGLFYGEAVAEAPEVEVRVTMLEPQVARAAARGAALHWQQQQQQQQQPSDRRR
jgi:transglutaminase-like putative cysteine protease